MLSVAGGIQRGESLIARAIDQELSASAVKAELSFPSIGAAVGCGVGLMVNVTVAVNSSLSFFLVKLTHAFGWSRTQYSLEYAVFGISAAILYPVGGWMIDRWGVRYVTLGGVILIGLTPLALAFQNGSLPVFY